MTAPHITTPTHPAQPPLWGPRRMLDAATVAEAKAAREALLAIGQADSRHATLYDTGVHDGYVGGFRWGCISGFCWGCAAGALAVVAALQLGWLLGA